MAVALIHTAIENHRAAALFRTATGKHMVVAFFRTATEEHEAAVSSLTTSKLPYYYQNIKHEGSTLLFKRRTGQRPSPSFTKQRPQTCAHMACSMLQTCSPGPVYPAGLPMPIRPHTYVFVLA
eukprot:scaffold14477_cov21-Tisochrysis_lutea.AAC.1